MSTESKEAYWAWTRDELLARLESSPAGLSDTEARARLARFGPNALKAGDRYAAWRPLARQLRSPLILILVFASAIALAMHDWTDAVIILVIMTASGGLSFVQEFHASRAIERLRAGVAIRCDVCRDGTIARCPASELVPGDVIRLAAGSLIPADAVLLEARDVFAAQAVLTGETFPVEKTVGASAPGAVLAQRHNCLFMGTSIRSGTATAVVVHTGRATAYGRIADRLAAPDEETEFERGLRRFGLLLMRLMLLVVLVVLSVNLLLGRPTVETLLFAMALAVGLSPELLPAILTLTLARGAQNMAHRGVIVRRLDAIENLGSMDVLCTDKTGTLTEARMTLENTPDAGGMHSPSVLAAAFANAAFQTGLGNPLDEAIIAAGEAAGLSTVGTVKLDEIPYDFLRKRLTVVVRLPNQAQPCLITKGALRAVLEVCSHYGDLVDNFALDAPARADIEARFASWSAEGYRVLGLALRGVDTRPRYDRDDEHALIFAGFLLFRDPPRADAGDTLAALAAAGVAIKIISGDNELICRHIAAAVGLATTQMLTGAELVDMRDEALWQRAIDTTVFAEIEPNQKERIIRALQRTGHVVGYLGDGINDAPALHAADVGLSVDGAVDVARESADFVLLTHDLAVLRAGIDEGRRTFANTIKYIFITTSANLGNMMSLALASLLLPFLPMLATQILLNNLLSSVPALGIAGDSIDAEWGDRPHRWNLSMIRYFMITFGLVSSAFDLLTFGLLLWLFHATPSLFRTGWFVESLLTQVSILLVVRTHRPFYRSRPGRFLLVSCIAVFALTLVLPYIPPVATAFSFVGPPPHLLAALLVISASYVAVSEATKRRFFRRFD